MSYQDMNGLELFGDPFSRPQAYNQPTSRNSYSKTTTQSRTTATQPEPQVQQPPTNPATQSKSPVLQQNSGNPIPESKSVTSTKELTPADVKTQVQQPQSTTNSVPQANTPILQKNPSTSSPQPVPKSETVISAITEEPAPADVKPQPEQPKKELVMDMSGSAIDSKATEDDTAKRKAHQEAEAKRKAEWEAKQRAKKQAEEAAIQKLHDMSDDDVIAASIERVSTDVERLTRRNMKECVAAHIQELARKDAAFARRTMHPRKSMINCFKYINRMAKEYVQQEMKDNDIKPDSNGYGSDVPDDIVYQWSEIYFNSTDVPEDQEKEEKFIPKPYVGTTSSKPSSKSKKTTTSKAKKTEKPATKEAKKKPEPKSSGYEQMSLWG